MSASVKERLHRLIDEWPEEELEAVEQALAALNARRADPLLRALYAAPWDDEPETDEERQAVEAARAAYARHETVSDDEVRRALGL